MLFRGPRGYPIGMRTLIAVLAALAAAAPANAEPASAAFRAEHVEVRKHLEHVREWTGALARQPKERRVQTAKDIVAFFEGHIVPHAEWEESKLYPVIDELAGTKASNRFTATMRHEHRIVGRWIKELRELAGKEEHAAFARRADNLLGLITAHFEEEEEVLLPLADGALTREEFERKTGLERH